MRQINFYYIKIKESTQQENITTINYASNIRTPKFIRQIFRNLKGQKDCNTIVRGDFNPTFNNRSSKQNINMKMLGIQLYSITNGPSIVSAFSLEACLYFLPGATASPNELCGLWDV
jgi:hypothetical protein